MVFILTEAVPVTSITETIVVTIEMPLAFIKKYRLIAITP